MTAENERRDCDAADPYSLESEESLLSCILLDAADVLVQCCRAGVTGSSFYSGAHRIIFESALSLNARGVPPDDATIAEELKRVGQLDAVGGFAFLTRVNGRMPTIAQAAFFVEQVRRLEQLRGIVVLARSLSESATKPSADIGELMASARATLDRVTDASPGLGSGVTAEQLCEKPPTVPPELIAGVLYGAGTMMLSGPSKSRKTYTFIDLGISVSTGSEWLGFATSQTGVLYLNFELSEHSFQRRLAAICAAKGTPPPPNFRSFNLRGKMCSMTMLAVELPRLIRTYGAGLVIIDPWYKISAQSGVEENSNDGQARILAEAERIVTANGAAVVVGHHFAKGDASAKNSIDRAAGAGAMARWGDVIATLSEHEEADAMTLELHLRDFAPVEKVALRWALPIWRRDETLDPAKLKKSVGRRDENPASELLSKLTDGMTNKEWNQVSGMKDGTYRRKRDDLISSKKVKELMSTYHRA